MFLIFFIFLNINLYLSIKTESTTTPFPSLFQYDKKKCQEVQTHNTDQSDHHDTRILIENIPYLFACLEEDSEYEDCSKTNKFRLFVDTFYHFLLLSPGA
jgi:hypothetical protein